jgi:hypothetical protein
MNTTISKEPLLLTRKMKRGRTLLLRPEDGWRSKSSSRIGTIVASLTLLSLFVWYKSWGHDSKLPNREGYLDVESKWDWTMVCYVVGNLAI